MKVYVVEGSIHYEGDYLLHIASSLPLAQDWRDKKDQTNKYYDRFAITEWEVDVDAT